MGSVPTRLHGDDRADRRRRPVALIVLGLFVAGAAVLTLWPRSAASATTITGDSESYRVELTTSPRRGPVTTSVRVTRHDHSPVRLDEIGIDAVMPSMGHAVAQVVATRQDDRFEVHGELFTMGGLWDVSLRVADETVTVQIPVTEGQA